MNENPFPIAVYKGPEYFCDREKELSQLREAATNGRNTLLFSPRRMGKSGLIHHLFHKLESERLNVFYVDIFGTEDLNGFINTMANVVLNGLYPGKENILKQALKLFGTIRPQISYNALSGIPQLSFTLQNQSEKQATLTEIFTLLEKQKVNNLMAIDEFQQISHYPEKNTEELLRYYIQKLGKTSFIFSGSQRHLVTPMFSDPKRAFYQSSSYMALGKLAPEPYKSFIINHFTSNNQAIAATGVEYIMEWSKRYTFYTQYLCNRIYSKRQSNITKELINSCIAEILSEREPVFYNFRNLLSHHQYLLLSAIAKEESVVEPTGQHFMKKYDLSNASTVRKSLNALIEKEMIYEIPGGVKPCYEVYDVFLARWFRWKAGIS